MNRKEISAALADWGHALGFSVTLEDAQTVSSRTVEDTAQTFAAERLCAVAVYAQAWHFFCFAERTDWRLDRHGDTVGKAGVTYSVLAAQHEGILRMMT